MFLHFKKEAILQPYLKEEEGNKFDPTQLSPSLDDIKDQEQSKRALIIAASGHHNRLLPGAPGAGKINLAHTKRYFLWTTPKQPLEDKKIDVSRTNSHITYLSDFILIATMGPYPCVYFGNKTKKCSCTSSQIVSYQKKLSGPLLDRLDLKVNISRAPNKSFLNTITLNNYQRLID